MQDNKNWEDRFDEEFSDYGGEYSSNIEAPRKMIKSFISTLLSEFADEVKKNMAKIDETKHTDEEQLLQIDGWNSAAINDHKALEAAKLKFGIK